MRKRYLILTIFLTIFSLTACQKQDIQREKYELDYSFSDEYELTKFINEEEDSKINVKLIISFFISELSKITESEEIFDDSLPIMKENLVFYSDYNNLNFFDSSSFALSTVQTELDYFNTVIDQVDYKEGKQVKLGSGTLEMNIAVNEKEIEYQKYSLDSNGRVNASYAYLTVYDEELLLNYRFISYDVEKDDYFFYREAFYHHNNHRFYRFIAPDEDSLNSYKGLVEVYANSKDNSYTLSKIDLSTDDKILEYRNYDQEENLYYYVRTKNDLVDFNRIEQYNSNNKRLFYMSRDDNETRVEYDLMEIQGWDKIDKDGLNKYLYLGDDKVILSQEFRPTTFSAEGKVYLYSRQITSNIQPDVMNLVGTGLTTQFSYQDMLDAENYSLQQANIIFGDMDLTMSKCHDIFNTILDYFDESTFTRIAELDK